ncbi:uncharacterized protein BDV17DRAFT_56388 [Aspergillus undulatus]|uniref:uncharacterized protein n=1 Tax=Aspergillus undulatus TaxID=1810928 RepID=UPI003CCD4F8E
MGHCFSSQSVVYQETLLGSCWPSLECLVTVPCPRLLLFHLTFQYSIRLGALLRIRILCEPVPHPAALWRASARYFGLTSLLPCLAIFSPNSLPLSTQSRSIAARSLSPASDRPG